MKTKTQIFEETIAAKVAAIQKVANDINAVWRVKNILQFGDFYQIEFRAQHAFLHENPYNINWDFQIYNPATSSSVWITKDNWGSYDDIELTQYDITDMEKIKNAKLVLDFHYDCGTNLEKIQAILKEIEDIVVKM